MRLGITITPLSCLNLLRSKPRRAAWMGHAALSLLTSPWAACVVDRVFPFEEIIETDLYLETNQQFGKIVVTV